MWWYGYGWWWWWVLFLVVFFVLPLGYGWGYRGWGPWWQRRPPVTHVTEDVVQTGWGVVGTILWVVLIIAIIWIIAALAWHR